MLSKARVEGWAGQSWAINWSKTVLWPSPISKKSDAWLLLCSHFADWKLRQGLMACLVSSGCRGSSTGAETHPTSLSLHPPHSLPVVNTHKCFFVLIWPQQKHYEVLQFEAYIQTQEGFWSCRWNTCNAGKGDQVSSESVNHCSPRSCRNSHLIPYTSSLTPPGVCKAFLHPEGTFSQMCVEILRLIWFLGGSRGI